MMRSSLINMTKHWAETTKLDRLDGWLACRACRQAGFAGRPGDQGRV